MAEFASGVPLLLLSESELLAAGLWDVAQEMFAVVEQQLCGKQEGWHGKVALAPTNEETSALLDLEPGTLDRYAGVRFSYKLNVLAALLPHAAGFKAIGANVMNREGGYSRADALYVLYDQKSLRPRTIIRCLLLSSLRTASYACIIQHRSRARSIGFLGSGELVRTTIRLLAQCAAPPVEEVRIYSPNLDLSSVRKSVGEVPFLLKGCDTAQSAVEDVQMVVTATTASSPVFDPSWLVSNIVHVNLGGCEAPLDFVELCLRSGTVIVDDFEGTLKRGTQSLALWWRGNGSPAATESVKTFDWARNEWDSLPRPWHVTCVGRSDLDVTLAAWVDKWARLAGCGREVTL